MKEIVVHHHLGLGDHFICNGLVHELSKKYRTIFLACKDKNYKTVNEMFKDTKNINIFRLKENQFFFYKKNHDKFYEKQINKFSEKENLEVIKIGFENCDRLEFNTSFYRQVGLDFSHRYTSFKLPNKIELEEEIFKMFSRKKYILVHRESSSRKYNLQIKSHIPIVEIDARKDPFGNLLNYRKLIQKAYEIHCINSSVFHFVDSIETKAKLFYHDVRKRDFKIESKWNIINYN